MIMKKMNIAECDKQQKVLSQSIGIGNTLLQKYCYWYWQ